MNKIMLAGTVMLAVISAAGCGAGHAAAARPSPQEGRTAGHMLAVKGTIPKLPDCRTHDIARVAVVRPGTSPAALGRLSTRPSARLMSTRNGEELAFFHAGASAPGANGVFSIGPEVVPADPALQSCSYLLQDRPAAQPYITAAIDAATAHGIAASPGSLRAKLNVAEIGDNPLQHGSLVILLLVKGTPSTTGPNGQTVYGPYSSIFVVLDRSTEHITGTAVGTW